VPMLEHYCNDYITVDSVANSFNFDFCTRKKI